MIIILTLLCTNVTCNVSSSLQVFTNFVEQNILPNGRTSESYGHLESI